MEPEEEAAPTDGQSGAHLLQSQGACCHEGSAGLQGLGALSVTGLSGRPSSLCGVIDAASAREFSSWRYRSPCAGCPECVPSEGGKPLGDALAAAMLEGYDGGGGAGREGGGGAPQLIALGLDRGGGLVLLVALGPDRGGFVLLVALGPDRGGEFALVSRSRVVKASWGVRVHPSGRVAGSGVQAASSTLTQLEPFH